MSLFNAAKTSAQQLLDRLEHSLRRRVRTTHRRARKGRQLKTEMLEPRQLLAADLELLRHNAFDPEDVNDDGFVAPLDALMVINSLNAAGTEETLDFIDVNNDGHRSPHDALMVINRLNRREQRHDNDEQLGHRDKSVEDQIPQAPADTRSIDGTDNNLANPLQGSAGSQLLRAAEAAYADGVSTPAGADRPSGREISNVLSTAEADGTRSDRGLSAFIYVWGQFLDHDIDRSATPEQGGEAFSIEVPTGDIQFDPLATAEATIPLTRSEFVEGTGTSVDNPRQQFNTVTSYVDGSMIYGSDEATALSLRTLSGGRLLMTEDGLVPTDQAGDVLAGDVRAGENISLTAMHALFVREHNRLATEIADNDPSLSDEEIYQQARAIVIAQIQSITYNQFLPALLGNRALSHYEGYDENVDATITTEFSTAAFRFGHSTLNDDVEFFDNEGRAILEEIPLADAFENPSLLEETGIDALLKYDASTQAQEIDLQVVDSLRNMLFGPPGAGGMDLVALNIQRGRDHGLSDYNATRVAYGLAPVEAFDEISSDLQIQADLRSLYGSVDNIDLWVGLLAEDHVRGASVGQLTQTIIVDQFERLRDGDRFWYENIYAGSDLRQLRQTTLGDIIERNSQVAGLQENVFFMRAELSGQVTALTDSAPTVETRRSRETSSSRTGVKGLTIELLNDEGNVIDSTTTDSRGRYRFGIGSIHETGDYQIRVGESNQFVTDDLQPLELLVSNGNTRLRGLDFEAEPRES